MTDVIRILLDGYDIPVFLSDAHQGTILFTNMAVQQKLGFSDQHLAGTRLGDVLKDTRVIKEQPIFEHNENQYLVQSDELTLSGTDYIKSVLKPFQKETVLSHLDFQKEMTSRLVHRIRSPLNGTLGFTELLKERSLDENQLRYVEAIENGLNDLKSVLSQIEVLGQPVTVQKTMVDFEQLAEQVLVSFLKNRQKRIRVIIDEKRKRTDHLLLKAIIEELVCNAFEHGPNDESPIIVHFGQDRIRVTNNGTPIPNDLVSKIFYPFFSSKARSIGIGLAKCSYYAKHLDLELKLAQNSASTGISFDIIFSDAAMV